MDAVEEIKSRLAIEDVLGEYVQLKRSGRNWKGLSPFSSEKTPSFVVSPEKQIWHDFSSGKGGDMFSFVMELEGLDFKGALELLARKAGVDLEQYQTSRSGGNTQQKQRLHEILELATRFYQTHLKSSHTALEYLLNKRAFSKATVLEWRLGYSPNNGTALVDFLKSKKFTDEEIKAAGLSSRSYRGGTQDMFRGRIMIPLADAQGQVIGFTARLLDDDPQAPKYINTPSTLLYDKSRHVYGLHLAKEMIRKSKFVVVAEGNLDVIASHQAGVRQVVATAGTALTDQHLKALSRFTGDIRLCFDTDKAGLAATERAIPIASLVGVSLSIITIPSGKDPDELIRQDATIWQEIIEKPQYALDWLMERYQALLDISSAQGKRQFSDVILAVIRTLTDQVEQEHYIDQLASVIGASREALQSKLQQTAPTVRLKAKKTPAASPTADKTTSDLVKFQDRLLALALLQPKLRDFLQPLTDMLVSDQARHLHGFLQANPDFAGDPAQAKVLQPLSDYVKILALQYDELYSGLELLELRYEAARLQARLIEQYVKVRKNQISQELATADETQTQTLLERAKQLDSLLKLYKGDMNG